MPKTAIIGAARTPFGKLGGGLSTLDATDLGGKAIEAALDRAGVNGGEVQHVVFGQVLQAGQGQIPSRQAQIKGGIPKEVSSETVNKVCASGIRGVGILDQAIRAGDLEVGDELEITRPDMDRYALRSHELAIEATDDGRLAEEIAPVTITSRKGETVVEADEAPRRESSLEALAKLPGLTGKEGSHTAGNSPGVNDGAGALVLSSDEWARRNGRQPLATIVAQAAVADDFPYLARTPANATKAALEKAGLKLEDIDLFEINEAFASVAINSLQWHDKQFGVESMCVGGGQGMAMVIERLA